MPDHELVTAKNVDLSNCDREQIQFAAATLAHGFLLVVEESGLTVVQASENASEFTGRDLDALIGYSVGAWLSPNSVAALRRRIQAIQADGPPVHAGMAAVNGALFDMFAHRCCGANIVEFEKRSADLIGFEYDIFARAHASIARLQQTAGVQEFLDVAVAEIRQFTGFERVMAYQFLADGSGVVRAESVTEGYEPFLGLHYPASDVPLPARRLFKLTWLRHQPDIDYTPSPIVPELNPLTGQPLDLSYSLLRSVSVMYSQYLKNMGTRASMVMTLLRNGELWGLIACHQHSAPRHVPFEVRAAAESLAHMVSLLLSGKDEQEDYEYRDRLQTTHARMAAELALTSHITGVLVDRRPGLMDFVNCGGAALVTEGRPVLMGTTPAAEQVQKLTEWLSMRDCTVFTTDHLSGLFPEAAEYCATASGLLVIRTDSVRSDYILWFRPEYRQTVRWAGDPKKPVDISEDGLKIRPRISFAIWKEAVRERSLPWKPVEVDAARKLRDAMLEISALRAGQLRSLYSNLKRTNVELDAFAYIASHDLKEPLRGIHNYTQFLIEDVGGTLPPDAVEKLETVIRLTRRMDSLLDSLLHYSRLGREGMNVEPCDVEKLVAEVIDTLALRIAETRAEVRVLKPLPPVSADYARLSEVFMNLISNALKYNDKEQKFVEIGWLGTNAGEERGSFYVRDNGIGIEPEHRESIFQIFRRLHPPDRFGGGTGTGLTIVRKILRRHEGDIRVESEPGKGSTFLFQIGVK